MIRLALFDIDGTLLLTSGAGRRAFIAALRETTGFDADHQPFDFAGRTDLEILRTLLRRAGIPEPDPGLGEKFWDSYLSILERELACMEGAGLCPGVADLLEALRADREFRVGLVTGNIEVAAHRKLSCFGIDSYFSFGAYGNDDSDRNRLVPLARARAEAIEGVAILPEACVVIGDTPHDVRCARAGSARVLAVATGFYAAGELSRENPDVLLDNLSDTGEAVSVLRRLTEIPRSSPATPHRGG